MNNIIKKKFSLMSTRPVNTLNQTQKKSILEHKGLETPKKMEEVELMPLFNMSSNQAKGLSKKPKSMCGIKSIKKKSDNKMTEGAQKFLNLTNYFSDKRMNSIKKNEHLSENKNKNKNKNVEKIDSDSNLVSSENVLVDGKRVVVNIHVHIDKKMLGNISKKNMKCKTCGSCKKKKPQKRKKAASKKKNK